MSEPCKKRSSSSHSLFSWLQSTTSALRNFRPSACVGSSSFLLLLLKKATSLFSCNEQLIGLRKAPSRRLALDAAMSTRFGSKWTLYAKVFSRHALAAKRLRRRALLADPRDALQCASLPGRGSFPEGTASLPRKAPGIFGLQLIVWEEESLMNLLSSLVFPSQCPHPVAGLGAPGTRDRVSSPSRRSEDIAICGPH